LLNQKGVLTKPDSQNSTIHPFAVIIMPPAVTCGYDDTRPQMAVPENCKTEPGLRQHFKSSKSVSDNAANTAHATVSKADMTLARDNGSEPDQDRAEM
jgi:hypothetical protein